MQAKEMTTVEVSSDIFNDKKVTVEGCWKTTIKLTYPEKQNQDMAVQIESQGRELQSKILAPGDTLTFLHEFKAKVVKDITKDHVFPITFKMDGQEYKLNRTKQNKLILTK
jgi:hypothetical protein